MAFTESSHSGEEYFALKSGAFHTLVSVLQNTTGILSWNQIRNDPNNSLMDETHFKKVARTILHNCSVDGKMARYEGLQVLHIEGPSEDYVISHIGHTRPSGLASKATPLPPRPSLEYRPLYPAESRKKNRNYSNGAMKKY